MTKNWISLDGRIAVVTGAAGGIGRAVAQGLSEVGASIAILDRDGEGARIAAEEIEAGGGRAIGLGCDVGSADEVARAADEIASALGAADILVNNAGFQSPGGLDTLPMEEWERLLSVNLTGYLRCAQIFGRSMLAKGSGSLIHIASVSGSSPQGFSGAYSVSKAGVRMLSQQLATEWGPRGVRSNVVSPGLIRTPMTQDFYARSDVLEARRALVPRRRIGEPADIANAVVFLASDRADYVTGEEITVDGGFTRTIMNVIPRPGFEAALTY